MIDSETQYFSEKLSRAAPPQWGHFRPFAVHFKMGAPAAVTTPWIAFDGLIAHLIFMTRLQDDFFITPKKKNIAGDFGKCGFTSPFRQTGSIFHASVSQFEPDTLRCTKIYKRFEERGTEELKQKHIRIGAGHFRAYMMHEPYIPAHTVTFYAFGDQEGIQHLIEENIFAIGNDYRIGFGAVRDISFEPMDADWSLVKDGVAMRPLPKWLCEEWDDEAWLPSRPPYWEPRNVELCVPPGAHVRLPDKYTNYDPEYLRRSERPGFHRWTKWI